jgi:hypothetical protein
VLYDRVSFATTTTGTGTVTAGSATTGFRTMATAAIPDGTTVEYTIEDGTDWETGTGAVGGTSTTLTRVVSQSSNSNALLNLSGSAKVFLTPIADRYNSYVDLKSVADPSTLPVGGIVHYSKLVAGRHLPKILGPSGIDTIMQIGLHGNSICMIAPASGTTAPTIWGGTLTTAATMSLQQTIASSSPWLATSRKRFQSAATAGSTTGMRLAYTQWFRGNAAGYGGFWLRTQFGQNLNLTGSQLFIGLCASTAILNTAAGSAGALLNCIGVGYDTTDANTGNFFLMRNDGAGTCTKVDLGSNAARSNTTHGYDLIIYCPPGAATDIYVRVVNLHSNVVVLDTSYNTDIPAVNTGLAFKAEVNNGAVASATNIEVAKVYIESDY